MEKTNGENQRIGRFKELDGKYYAMQEDTTLGDHAPNFKMKSVLPNDDRIESLLEFLYPEQQGICFMASADGSSTKRWGEQEAAKCILKKSGNPRVNRAGWSQFSCCFDPQLFCRKMSEEDEDKDEENKGEENSEAQVEEKSVSQGAVMES